MADRFPFRIAGDVTISRGDCNPSLEPIGDAIYPIGCGAPAGIQLSRQDRRGRLARAARLVLADPHLMRRLSDRIYALWQEDRGWWRDRDRPGSNLK